jgi:ankyrin repeat protein
LIWAAVKGHIGICRLLVQFGADVNAKDEYFLLFSHLQKYSLMPAATGIIELP